MICQHIRYLASSHLLQIFVHMSHFAESSLGTIPKKAAHPSDNALIPLACSMLHPPLVLSPWSIVCKLPVYHVYCWVGLPPPQYSLKLHEVRSLCLFVHLYILCSSTSSWPICLHKYLLNEWVNELIDWFCLELPYLLYYLTGSNVLLQFAVILVIWLGPRLQTATTLWFLW